jgi:hypothetical protein
MPERDEWLLSFLLQRGDGQMLSVITKEFHSSELIRLLNPHDGHRLTMYVRPNRS